MTRPGSALFLVILITVTITSCSKSSANDATTERPAVAVEAALVAPSDIEDTIEVVGTLAAKF